jgi:TonB family protein
VQEKENNITFEISLLISVTLYSFIGILLSFIVIKQPQVPTRYIEVSLVEFEVKEAKKEIPSAKPKLLVTKAPIKKETKKPKVSKPLLKPKKVKENVKTPLKKKPHKKKAESAAGEKIQNQKAKTLNTETKAGSYHIPKAKVSSKKITIPLKIALKKNFPEFKIIDEPQDDVAKLSSSHLMEIVGPAAKRKAIYQPKFKLPSWIEERGIRPGEIKIKFWVQPDGTVDRTFIEKSSGYGSLDRLAEEAILRWRFHRINQDKEEWGLVIVKIRIE